METPVKDYGLKERDEPQLYEDRFAYDAPPGIGLPGVDLRDRRITDTTFRDGQQAVAPWTPGQVVEIFKHLHRMSGPNGLISQSEFYIYTDRDRKAVDLCRELGYEYPEVTSWIRGVKKDVKYVVDMGIRETGVLTSTSDTHIFIKLRLDRQKAFSRYIGVVGKLLEHGIIPRCNFEDVTRADFDGFVRPFAEALVDLSEQARIPVKIMICDTLGVAVPYESGPLPISVPKLVKGLLSVGVRSENLEWHGHDDYGYGLINAVTAWMHGCRAANGTIFGFGERAGNTALELLAVDYWRKTGSSHGMDLSGLCELAQYFCDIGIAVAENHPLVGKNAFATAAGVHIEGMLRGLEAGKGFAVYSSVDPKIFGNEVRFTLTDKSGDAIIIWLINKKYGGEVVNRTHLVVSIMRSWIHEQYVKGRTTKISEAEFYEELEKHKHLIAA
ncbi:MAG: beta/alpha barrel domain-containing protein [Planctomycetota bacterium]|jgi:isopropylmalate/homocitrate/citramalate synthase